MTVDVYLKLDNVMHQIKDKVAEIRITIPKHELFVKQTTKSFEESFDLALDAAIGANQASQGETGGCITLVEFFLKFHLKIFAFDIFRYLCIPQKMG